MEQIRKRLTYANVVSSLALFLVLAGGGAVAASQLAENSVGSKQLKKNAVTAAKIKDGAVTGAKVKLDTLGTIPSATRADSAARADTAARATSAGRADAAALADVAARADSATTADTAKHLDDQITFSTRPFFGDTRTVATHGAVSLEARCQRNNPGIGDRIALLARTQVNGAVTGGRRDFTGTTPAEFLNVGATAVIAEAAANNGETRVLDAAFDDDQDDAGFVLGPDGKGLIVNAEGLIFGLNFGGSGCLVTGVVNLVG